MNALVVSVGLALALTSLCAGGLAAISMGVARAGVTLDGKTWPVIHRALDRTIGPYFAALVFSSIVSTAVTALFFDGERRIVAGASTLSFITTLALTVIGNLPINRAVRDWPDTPPADWEASRARWNRFQHARAIAALCGFACLVIAGLMG